MFEIEFGPDDAVTTVRSPADLAMLLARLPEPWNGSRRAERRRSGSPTSSLSGSSRSCALSCSDGSATDVAQLATLSARTLVDIGTIGRDRPQATWVDEVRAYFDAMVSDRLELDRLTGGAPTRRRSSTSGSSSKQEVQAAQRDTASRRRCLVSSVMLTTSGGRKRYVPRTIASGWGVSEAHLWEDAAANLLATRISVVDAAGPVRKYFRREPRGRGTGSVLNRLPDACPNGYILGLIHKGAAMRWRIDDAGAIGNLGRFRRLPWLTSTRRPPRSTTS